MSNPVAIAVAFSLAAAIALPLWRWIRRQEEQP